MLGQAMPGRFSASENISKLDMMFDPIGYLNKEMDKKRGKLQSQEYFPPPINCHPPTQ